MCTFPSSSGIAHIVTFSSSICDQGHWAWLAITGALYIFAFGYMRSALADSVVVSFVVVLFKSPRDTFAFELCPSLVSEIEMVQYMHMQ